MGIFALSTIPVTIIVLAVITTFVSSSVYHLKEFPFSIAS